MKLRLPMLLLIGILVSCQSQQATAPDEPADATAATCSLAILLPFTEDEEAPFYYENEEAVFKCEVTDSLNHSLENIDYLWTSDLLGPLDTNPSLPIRSLQIGLHKLRVVVTFSDNTSLSDSLSVSIVEDPYADTDLMNDHQLRTPPYPSIPDVNEVWKTWIEQNHHTLRSITSSDFSDLAFLPDDIGDRRIVQLGESGHGVSEFNTAKVRLIKFLHEEMAFDVIAFESGLFECHFAEMYRYEGSAMSMMETAIFRVWHCHEVIALFEYLHECRESGRPLILAGFDIQIMNSIPQFARPQFFRSVISAVDPVYAQEVYDQDSDYLETMSASSWNVNREAEYVAFYEDLVAFIDDHREELIQAFGEEWRKPLIARQTAWSMTQHGPYRSAHVASNTTNAMHIRDEAMAVNIEYLLDEVYPDKKIIVWAHNSHIRHNEQELHVWKSTGTWLYESRRQELYTVGLYMFQGRAADNMRDEYTVTIPIENSLEAILYHTRKKYAFIDMLHQARGPGNEWMFIRTPAKSWGTWEEHLTLYRHYNAILFIHTVQPPDYTN